MCSAHACGLQEKLAEIISGAENVLKAGQERANKIHVSESFSYTSSIARATGALPDETWLWLVFFIRF